MPVELKLFPGRPDDTQTVTLGSSVFRLRFFYRRRLRAWYMDLYDQSGTALLRYRRLSPGWAPMAGIIASGMPAGQLYVTRIPEPYERADLGDGMLVRFYGADELPASTTTLTTLTVT